MIVPLPSGRPELAGSAWIAHDVTLVGPIRIGSDSSVWFGSVVRADGEPIEIQAGSNIQDGCVLHTDAGWPLTIGKRVSVGHRAVLHGCSIGDDVLVGIGATVLNGARIGAGSIVGAGAVVLEGTDVPPRSVVTGVPGRIRAGRTEQVDANVINAANYIRLAGLQRGIVK